MLRVRNAVLYLFPYLIWIRSQAFWRFCLVKIWAPHSWSSISEIWGSGSRSRSVLNWAPGSPHIAIDRCPVSSQTISVLLLMILTPGWIQLTGLSLCMPWKFRVRLPRGSRLVCIVWRAGSGAGDKDVVELNSKCVSRDKNQNILSKSYYCLLYKRTSKERRKGNPPTPSTLSVYTIRLPPSNHSPCSDVPSESHLMILHTTPLFLIVATSPPRPTSQHLRSLLYLTKLNYHHLAASSASSNVSTFP